MSIANMITQIKNAQAVGKEAVKVPYTNVNFEVAKILADAKYVSSAEKKGRGYKRYIEIVLRYRDGKGAINDIGVVSAGGKRVYVTSRAIRPYRQGAGMYIISTSQGVKIDKEARKLKIGGEMLCRVW